MQVCAVYLVLLFGSQRTGDLLALLQSVPDGAADLHQQIDTEGGGKGKGEEEAGKKVEEGAGGSGLRCGE